MYTTSDTNSDHTVFYYELDTLFDKASILSMYKADSIDGMDKFSLSEKERDFFNVKLKNGAGKVFEKISRLSQGISDAFQYNESLDTYSSIDTEYDNCIIYVAALPTYWDDNITKKLDYNIEEALISYILQEWYKIRSMNNDHLQELANFGNLLSNVKSCVLYRTTRPTKTYNMSIPNE